MAGLSFGEVILSRPNPHPAFGVNERERGKLPVLICCGMTTDCLEESLSQKRTRVGRRNLLTTASNGSASGLQEISDRLADNFSILPGHHCAGDEEDDSDLGGGCLDEGEEDGGEGDGLVVKSFAMFECGRKRAADCVRELREGARDLFPPPPLTCFSSKVI